MTKVVILRPEPGASATLARAKAQGIAAVAIPLFEIAPLSWAVPDATDYDAMLLTSANAVRFAGKQLAGLRDLPAYCVGEATATAAREAGLTVAAAGSGDAAALVELASPDLRLLHLTGKAHRALPGIAAIIVYDSAAIDPPPSLAALTGGVAMVHSPRAGRRLAELVEARGDIGIAAISAAAAAACGGGWREVTEISKPDDGALLALAATLCQNADMPEKRT